MFIIVDLGALIIFLAILGIGLGYTIISNIGPILFMITAIIAFFGGGYEENNITQNSNLCKRFNDHDHFYVCITYD